MDIAALERFMLEHLAELIEDQEYAWLARSGRQEPINQFCVACRCALECLSRPAERPARRRCNRSPQVGTAAGDCHDMPVAIFGKGSLEQLAEFVPGELPGNLLIVLR